MRGGFGGFRRECFLASLAALNGYRATDSGLDALHPDISRLGPFLQLLKRFRFADERFAPVIFHGFAIVRRARTEIYGFVFAAGRPDNGDGAVGVLNGVAGVAGFEGGKRAFDEYEYSYGVVLRESG